MAADFLVLIIFFCFMERQVGFLRITNGIGFEIEVEVEVEDDLWV
jgi:hypothetical protein